jgi:hypothetical protein
LLQNRAPSAFDVPHWLQNIVRPRKDTLESGPWLSLPGADVNLVFRITREQDGFVIAKDGSARHNNGDA